MFQPKPNLSWACSKKSLFIFNTINLVRILEYWTQNLVKMRDCQVSTWFQTTTVSDQIVETDLTGLFVWRVYPNISILWLNSQSYSREKWTLHNLKVKHFFQNHTDMKWLELILFSKILFDESNEVYQNYLKAAWKIISCQCLVYLLGALFSRSINQTLISWTGIEFNLPFLVCVVATTN